MRTESIRHEAPPSTEPPAVPLLVAAWLIALGVGYAATLGQDLVGAVVFPIDNLLPAYAGMLAAVALLLVRGGGPRDTARGGPRDTARGGPRHGR